MAKKQTHKGSSAMKMPGMQGVQGFHSPWEGVKGGKDVGEQGPASKGLGSKRQPEVNMPEDVTISGESQEWASDRDSDVETLPEHIEISGREKSLDRGRIQTEDDVSEGQPIQKSNRGGMAL